MAVLLKQEILFAVDGHVLINGYEPDGDTIRFVPNDPSHLIGIPGSGKPLMPPPYGVRLLGVDAPELHYIPKGAVGSPVLNQPLAMAARDTLLHYLGYTSWTNAGLKVKDAQPSNTLNWTLLVKSIDTYGRLLAYITPTGLVKSGQKVQMDPMVLGPTVNYHLVQEGIAYPFLSTSMTSSSIPLMKAAGAKAQYDKKGVWKLDETLHFLSNNYADLDSAGSTLLVPKVFRKYADYLFARSQGFVGDFVKWLTTTKSVNPPVRIDGKRVHLSTGATAGQDGSISFVQHPAFYTWEM